MPAGAMTSSRVFPISALNRSTIGCTASPTSGSAKAKPSTATIRRSGRADGIASSSMTVETRAERCSIAGKPAGRVRTRRLRQHAGYVDAAVRWPDAVKPTEACWDAHRSTRVGADSEIDEQTCDGDRRAARRSAGDIVRRSRVDRRAVMRVLSKDAARNFIGAVFPINVAPASTSAWIAPGIRWRMRGEPVRVAASGYMSGDIEQVLRRKAKPASGPPARPSIWTRGPGTKALMSSSDMKTSGRDGNEAPGSGVPFF